MKLYLTILNFIIVMTIFGQTKDRRAELDIRGRVNEISVSPDEKIWLVTGIGKTYFTNNIDSNWHYGSPLFHNTDDFGFNNPNLERISFFNKDTAIITGYISYNDKDNTKNGYYLTKDAGKTWELLNYGGDSWIYTIHTDKNGNAWMGGLSKELYYSNNFGINWKKIKLPFKSSDRTYGIYMINSTSGIASSDDNEIITTEDNWKTVAHLKTPFDQKKYQPNETSPYVDKRISKIIYWNNYIVVNQYGHIFYSEANTIDWKPFPIRIIDFEIDNDSKKLYAVTDSLKIILFSTPTEYKTVSNQQLSSFPASLNVVNHSLYIVTNENDVYKVNEKGMALSIPYTTDHKISQPGSVKQFSKLLWGINGNQIYLAEDSKKDWYRENNLDFYISDFTLLSDSIAILWDGSANNYLYSLKDHTAKPYFLTDPIKNFIAVPVKCFSINSGSRGCFHSVKNVVSYERTNDSTFTTSNVSVNEYDNKKPSTFNNKVSSYLLSKTLAYINLKPSEIPSLKDFKITNIDKENYLTLVNQQLKSKESDYIRRKKKINKDFYYSIPAKLDTINNTIIETILNEKESWTSTTSNWFTIQIINQNNDTLNISRNYYINTLPWNLPWQFEYKGLNFICYNIEFSKFINTCIPNDFMGKEAFDNKNLIMQIADYLYNMPK